MSTTVTKILKPTIVNETNFGYTHNRWGFKAADDFDYTSLYRVDARHRSATVRAVRGVHRSARARQGSARRSSTSGRMRRDSARPAATGRTWRTSAWEREHPVGRRTDSPPEPERPVRLQQRSVDDVGPPQHQDGCRHRVQPEDRAGFRRLHGKLRFRPRREQPAEHRQRLREHAARRLHDLHRADEPRRSRRPALAERFLRAGQLARDAAADG